MINIYAAAIIVSLLLSALSQVLLKKSSGEKKKSFIEEYLNVKVITAYIIYFVVALIVIYAYTGIEYRVGAALSALSYLVLMSCGRIFFKEKLTLRRIIGNCVIVLGVIIFSLNI